MILLCILESFPDVSVFRLQTPVIYENLQVKKSDSQADLTNIYQNLLPFTSKQPPKMAHAMHAPNQSATTPVSASPSVSVFQVMPTADRVRSCTFETIPDHPIEEFVRSLENNFKELNVRQ